MQNSLENFDQGLEIHEPSYLDQAKSGNASVWRYLSGTFLILFIWLILGGIATAVLLIGFGVFLGVPFNIASYALLTMMVAHVTGLEPHEFVHTFGDAHLYTNHLGQAETQLQRDPRPLPKMHLKADVNSIFDFSFDDFRLESYDPHPHISAPVAV